ncbi:MAG: L,D-transpeptidase family protein [Myxococcales bacterium]|nr:L,D-transpeptidase family protein [Myxococcales bacterium]
MSGLLACEKGLPTTPSPASVGVRDPGDQSARGNPAPGAREPSPGVVEPARRPNAASGEPAAPAVDAATEVEMPAPKGPRTARRLADALLGSVRKHLETEGATEDQTRRLLEVAVPKVKRFRRLITAAYTARQYRPFASRGDRLTDEGKLAVELVLDVESHGIEPSPYPVERLAKAATEYEGASKEVASLRKPTEATPVARLAAIAIAFEPRDDETYSEQRKRVAEQILDAGLSDADGVEALVQDVDAWLTRTRESEARLRKALVDIDVAVVGGFLQYVLDFQKLTVAHPHKALPAEDIARAPERFKKELLAELQSAGDKLGTAMRHMWPRHPNYQKTRAALAKYRQLAQPGVVPAFKLKGQLKKGMKGPRVLDLRRRLAAEGFFDGDQTVEVFDEELETAVKRFQAHRQLRVDGVVRDASGLEGAVKRSLAVPMSDRVKQLRLSLQRWRESPLVKEEADFYFRVNIPQFEVEVWNGDKVERKHRLVVGNNAFEIDQDHGRKGHLNRTALISNAVSMVVLNPVWNVPERIRIQEVMVEAAKDPGFMDKHNYKVRVLNDGREQIYQEAGPGNALGQVKLLFPNEFAIYMHDTPKKKLFDRAIRAFSHGCMRLHDPVGMATFLLARDGQSSASKVNDILKSRKEKAFRLKTPVPIHVEYNTVGFDQDDEEPIFFSDVYGYDKAYWAGELPLAREEEIPVVKTELPMSDWERDEDPRDDAEAPAPSFDVDAPAGEKPAGEKPAPSEKPTREEKPNRRSDDEPAE